MRRYIAILGTALFGFALLTLFAPVSQAGAETASSSASQTVAKPTPTKVLPAARVRVHTNYGKLPLHFEPNQGQTDPQVKFLSRGKGYTLFLTPTEAVLALRKPKEKPETVSGEAEPSLEEAAAPTFTVLRMRLAGASPTPQVSGLEELLGKSHYLVGDRSKWRTNVPNYAKVKYEGIYPGIDLVYYGNQRLLEHDFVVAPGADPDAIRLSFQGQDKLSLDEDGNLILQAEGGEVILHAPFIYQEAGGARQIIPGRYVLHGENQVSFQVAAYDASRPLVIDPVLVYSTYLGGTDGDFGNGIAVDGSGNAYVTGTTSSGDFPTEAAFQPTKDTASDAFVTKLNPAGTMLVYSTYLGGDSGDTGNAIALDPGCASDCPPYVTGLTGSADFPTTSGAFQEADPAGDDAFVTKLKADGSLPLYSTYLGGSGSDEGNSIAVDGAGSAYVTGSTASTDFPTTSGAFQEADPAGDDAFVTVLNPAGGDLLYSTYLGGSGSDFGIGIAVDGAGNAYVTGDTGSDDFPTTTGAFQAMDPDLSGTDAFVTKLDPAGLGAADLVYSTYLGGDEGTDTGFGIALDTGCSSDCPAYVTGSTLSDDFPTATLDGTLGGAQDAFVTKLNAAGSALVYSTYLGGSGTDEGFGIAADGFGSAYVTGFTFSANFPKKPPSLPGFGGGIDAFVTKLNPAGSALAYSAFLGGSGSDFGNAIAVDGVGSAYVTGETSSADFPTASFQNDLASAPDAFVTKLRSLTNHFLCYRVRRGKGSPKFVKRQIILEDLIDIEEFVLKKPKSLCNPATKGLEGVDDPSTHLVSHKVKGPRRHFKRRDIKVVNQFGTIFVDTKRPTRLFVPSVKDLTAPVDLPEPFTHNVNHFKCYKTKTRKKVCEKNRRVRCISDADCTAAGLTGACNLGFTKGIIVDVVDQFSDKRFDVLKPRRLCIPADKDNEGIKEVAGPDSLMCYRVKRAKNQPKHEKVIDIHVNNQFGPRRLDAKKPRELCVPSLITLE